MELAPPRTNSNFGRKSRLERSIVLFKGLMRTARKTNEAGVLMQHPEWNDENVEKDLDLNLNLVDHLLT